MQERFANIHYLHIHTDFTSFRREISEEEAKEKAAFLGAKYSG